MSERSRYIIGVDLGTTNSCVAYVDTHTSFAIQPFRIPQLTAVGFVEEMSTLPSACYLLPAYERTIGALALPWITERDYVVGAYAQAQGAKVATRLVQSAKSWLCNVAANRRDKILPLEAGPGDERLSPVEATTYYLKHIREAWNHRIGHGNPENEFEQQEIILTVPASFDEVARVLTIEAAKAAGFTSVTLLEEPQAAFYSWISCHEENWQSHFQMGDVILVCDVGGGTTDFSLIEVSDDATPVARFKRMAVGNHLLLGGDNMDALIAHHLESKFTHELSTAQWLQLKHHARCAKEALLAGENHYTIVIQGTGSAIVQGTLTAEITSTELCDLLLNGFFGQYTWDEALNLRKTSGMRTMGLPYEDEPSITKQLAHFLSKNPLKTPRHILFNGGAMHPQLFQKAIVQAMHSWFPAVELRKLTSASLDLAVARGAAYFGKVRRGLGVRIGGGSSRTYYLGVGIPDESGNISQEVMTILPRGCEEGYFFEPDRQFWMMPNRPIAFDLYASHVRIDDQPGELIPIDLTTMHKLPPIHTVLRFGNRSQDKIAVHLCVRLTEIGTLELWLSSQQTEHRWFLEFQLRSSQGQEDNLATLQQGRVDETFDASHLKEAIQVIHNLFAGKGRQERLMEQLEAALQQPRKQWSLSVLRGLWPAVLELAPQRMQSPDHEMRWWNLAGFLLKPGAGYPLDDFRMKELWKVILGDLKLTKQADIELQRCICLRRVANGLNKGQQLQLAHHLFPMLTSKKTGAIDLRGKNEEYSYAEKVRTLASLELLDIPFKLKLGTLFLKRMIAGKALESEYWALGRIGARHLVYGSIANVIPRGICQEWIEELLRGDKADAQMLIFVMSQLARKTAQREINIPQETVQKILLRFPEDSRLRLLVEQESALTPQEQERVYGEQLPPGLLLTKG